MQGRIFNSQLCFWDCLYFLHFYMFLSICSSFYSESFNTPGNKGLKHNVPSGLKYLEHPGSCECGWCSWSGIGKNRVWRQGWVCFHPNFIRNCLQSCAERLRATFDDCGLKFRHLISVFKCRSLSVGVDRITPLLTICAESFSSMFPLAPVGEGGAGLALLWGAPLVQSKERSGNSMLGYKGVIWKAE